MCTYLHTRGRRYYFRRSVPCELAPFILTSTGKPRLEWLVSLGTSDRATAKRLIPEQTIRTEAELTDARAKLGSAPRVEPVRVRSMRAPSEGELEAMAFLDQHARKKEWAYDRREEARQQLTEQLAGSTASMPQMVQAARDLIRRADHAAMLADERRVIAEFNLAEAKALPPAQPVPPPSPAGKTDAAIMSLFDGYILSGAFYIEQSIDLAVRNYFLDGSSPAYAAKRKLFDDGLLAQLNFDRRIALAGMIATERGLDAAELKASLGSFKTIMNAVAHNPCWFQASIVDDGKVIALDPFMLVGKQPVHLTKAKIDDWNELTERLIGQTKALAL